MKLVVIAISLLLSGYNSFAATTYQQLLKKAYGAADTIYDAKHALDSDQIGSLDQLYIEIEDVLRGDSPDECSDPSTVYKAAYAWAFDTWRSTGKAKAHAERLCLKD